MKDERIHQDQQGTAPWELFTDTHPPLRESEHKEDMVRSPTLEKLLSPPTPKAEVMPRGNPVYGENHRIPRNYRAVYGTTT